MKTSKLPIVKYALITTLLLFINSVSANTQIKHDENQRLDIFFEQVFQQYLARHPTEQSSLGIKDDYDKWNDISDAFAKQSLTLAKNNLQTLRQDFDYQKLNTQSQLSYRLFEKMVEDHIEGYRWRHHNYPVTQMFGTHTYIASFLANIHKIDNKADANAYIERLYGIKPLLDQLIEGIKIREEKGVVPPQFVFPLVLGQINNIISGAPFDKNQPDSPLLSDFRQKVTALNLPDKQSRQLMLKAQNALLESVKPGYQALAKLLEQQQQRATNDDGAWKLPDGNDFYAYRLRRLTTTDLTPEQIHQYGLQEIERIHTEMKSIMKQVGFTGSLKEFFAFLQNDPRFFYPQTEEGRQAYIDNSTQIIEQMKKRLNEVFNTKPKADLIVKAVEPYREKSAGWAFYMRPALDGSRPGIFYINLYDLANSPRYSEEALAYHEGLPGHHMQLAIAQELENVPKFRTLMMSHTVFTEGWGLYSEYLPKEMGGFYQDPYSDFGRLSMELWRAIRLVVDTGLHYKKWTRQQTIDFHVENSSRVLAQAVKATERYIVMPGQATAYKIGMRKILELRELAKTQLGERFDLGEYHDVVLTNGPLPLSILEENVKQWISSKAQ